MTEPISILVADDHPVVRDGLVAMLDTQPDFTVVAQAADGREAVAAALAYQPDVVLLDLEMPGLDGVEALRQMRQARPTARVIVFTAFDSDERILGALQAGAQGYLLKGAPRQELFNAVRVVHAGGSLLQPVVASRLLRHVVEEGAAEAADGLVEPLTLRELEVLALLGRGLQNKQIAAELVIAERTVKFHISSIMGKLGVGNRTEAVAVAVQRGLIAL